MSPWVQFKADLPVSFHHLRGEGRAHGRVLREKLPSITPVGQGPEE
jgi:hypothetical protein